MEKDELINKLEHMNKPNIESEQHKAALKLTLLNARKSGRLGIFMVIIPLIFLACIFLKYLLHIGLPSFSSVENWMAEKDKNPFYRFLIPLILIGAPLLGLGINLLAILHVERKKEPDELIITVKLHWINIAVSIICALILFAFLLYAIGENFNR
jgi:hypothetical protein